VNMGNAGAAFPKLTAILQVVTKLRYTPLFEGQLELSRHKLVSSCKRKSQQVSAIWL
jgi:hypothetical protein